MKLSGRRCKCSACGEHFNSAAGFDKHRIGQPPNRRCRTVEEMTAIGMARNAGGWWLTKEFKGELPENMKHG